MWALDTIWFDIAIVSFLLLIGQILFGHFEERTPRARILLKNIGFILISIGLSLFVSRAMMFLFLGLILVMAMIVHFVYLPKKGIHPLTGKPKKKYYELRGWDTDIFSESEEE